MDVGAIVAFFQACMGYTITIFSRPFFEYGCTERLENRHKLFPGCALCFHEFLGEAKMTKRS